ncbi:cupin domain-containing protein [Convivina praedatoris]|uniref:DUF985 domain-containing protein n=1 Tax=Convivina praedatoris TaxID=2880963 RepID=A0ABN8HAC6_9LACO|nr:cupin domain-containing protein [Convivina sp. LMG 32447]CAH1855876.1 hypothetical protein R077815_01297 [Convivina sp. LMG 32447]CAH1856635.1 hypothetical protein LMG032447_01333 [Convivina sp. LMG 32447]CAH1856844.1 hypothetical protein R078138_01450 [Convivina sp. LMG 32447]
MKSKEYWIKNLQLVPHPEGRFYKEMPPANDYLEDRKRPLYTNIYFLLTEESPSHFHRLTSDEVWYFHGGSSLKVHEILPDGQYRVTNIGTTVDQGEVLQYVVPKGSIFGSSVDSGDDYALVSCMVSPGFTFDDFEIMSKSELLKKYPQHAEIIEKLALESK